MFDELKQTATIVLIVIILFYVVKFGYQFYEWYQFEQIPNVWELRDGQFIQIKSDGNWQK